ncbi:unnamed protein product [Echinostoma caproni]|uniref:Gag_pre-integrs domain-containing protein n=1 Tax=Echinostoma caproni TaxID=27848 RepID=A0A183AQ69_9TREM|nr:unnamed protein product [Echinostoma caproni]
MVRNPNQDIYEFILELITRAAECDFVGLLHMQLKERLIAGINNGILQNKLLKLCNPTFKDVRAHCEQCRDIRASTSSMPSTVESTNMSSSVKTNSRKFMLQLEVSTQLHTFAHVTYSDKSYGYYASCGKRHSKYTSIPLRFMSPVWHNLSFNSFQRLRSV